MAEKPKLGLSVTVAAGVTNIILDALFITVFHWGLAGAALASAISQMVGGVFPLVYFGRKNTSLLKLVKPEFDGGALLKGCANGSSELMSGIAMCHKKQRSKTRCISGHFVCDECHMSGMDEIISICFNSKSVDPLEIMEKTWFLGCLWSGY